MRTILMTIGLAAIASVLAACGTPGGTREEGTARVEERGAPVAGAETGTGGARTQAFPGGAGVVLDPLQDPDSPLARRVVYFDYDSSEIRPEDRELLSAHARYLALHPGVRVVVEGHTDERGSREYNIGLGERRAQAVRRWLLFQGVGDDQIETVSYGEERPAVEGHDEAAWARNRRVVLVYRVGGGA